MRRPAILSRPAPATTTSPAAAVPAEPAASTRARDGVIDVIRGVCIVLMTSSHLAVGTVVDRALHPAPWVDGASGFVLMSGLVLGMVQPGRFRRGGLRGASVQLVRRALMLYAIHVALVLLSVVAGLLRPSVAWFPDVEDHGGIARTVGATLLLRVNPPDIDILSLYVILLLLAVPALVLLAKGRAWLLGVASVALYVGATAAPALFTLPMGDGRSSKFNWGTWQLLFLAAFVVGWSWKRYDLRHRLAGRTAFLVAAGTWFGVTLLGVLLASAGLVPALQPALHQAYYDKTDQGLGRLVLAGAAFVTLYAALTWLSTRYRLRALRPVERLGRRSLSAFVVLTLITVLVPLVAGREVHGPGAVVVMLGALLVMYGYVLLRPDTAAPARVAEQPLAPERITTETQEPAGQHRVGSDEAAPGTVEKTVTRETVVQERVEVP